MGIARYLSKLASVLSTDGVVPASKGGTGVTSPGASGNLLVSNGTSWTSAAGLAGPTGPAGLGFTIAKTYSSVAALTADTAPSGIVSGQFALIDTNDINNAENSRLYVWNGTSYTYTSDLSGAQGIVGPTGPQGTNGTIGVNGTTGPTGPTGPAGTAPTGGATYYTGDIVISANSAQYTSPTWLPCDGAMYTPGTYPQLDTLYQTAGDYTTTPGIFTEPRYNDGTTVTFGSVVTAPAVTLFDPIAGDLLHFNNFAPAGSKIQLIQRASDGRFVFNPSNTLAANVQADYGSTTGIPYFAISPNGQLLVVYRANPALITVYKRNTLATETSTGVRWVISASVPTIASSSSYYNTKINNDGLIMYPFASTSSFAYQKYDIPSQSLGNQTIISGMQTTNGLFSGGIDYWSGAANYMAVATGSGSYQSGMYAFNGGGISLVSGLPTGSYNLVVINNAGTAAYFTRSTFIDIYNIAAGSGALTLNSSISIGTSVQSIAFSAGDAFMAVANTNGIAMYQRSSPGAVTYTATGYSPEAYTSQGIVNGNWRLQFDPVYNALVGFGTNGTTSNYIVRNWKGTAKTIVPSTANPGNKLKYYIKTGS